MLCHHNRVQTRSKQGCQVQENEKGQIWQKAVFERNLEEHILKYHEIFIVFF